MLETVESCVDNGGGFGQLQQQQQQQSCAESSSEEELSVLPRHTKVVVTGNNRTKSVLVGLQGVVKKAVGLGGGIGCDSMLKFIFLDQFMPHFLGLLAGFGLHDWLSFVKLLYALNVPRDTNWQVLTNGIEVKLQRNALSVLEPPTGLEDDDDLECENATFNVSDMTSDDTQKPHRQRQRSHRSVPLSPKTMSRSLSCDSQSKESVFPAQNATKIDLSKLETAALWRYLRHFNLVDAIPNPSKEHLIDIVQRHFMSQQLDELQVILGFVQAAKRLKPTCN
ncbi:hypothetical protein Syun_004982 [Stephania yunnanensis]|uniref:Histone deacetylase complex subunit SAP30 Sin3 binding domain-containing protein n=1 Tax=Stephania yunnanensis TaxID=152371 RepID=A0AAP0Q1X2_9MAGN